MPEKITITISNKAALFITYLLKGHLLILIKSRPDFFLSLVSPAALLFLSYRSMQISYNFETPIILFSSFCFAKHYVYKSAIFHLKPFLCKISVNLLTSICNGEFILIKKNCIVRSVVLKTTSLSRMGQPAV